MNWKFWTWRQELEWANRSVANMKVQVNDMLNNQALAIQREKTVERQLTVARRALARSKDAGLTDDQMAEAFTHLLENKGFEAILQFLASEELAAADSMADAKATFPEMKHHAGAVAALTHFHARLIELEEQAKEMAAKKS